MSQDGSANRLQYDAEPIPYFVKSLITGISILIYVPAAEKLTEFLQYLTGRLKFADGTSVKYEGNAAILKEPLLPVAIVIWLEIIMGALVEQPLLSLIVTAVLSLASAYVTFQLMKVVARNLVTNHGSRLEFSAKLEDYLKWQLILTACSLGPGLIGLILPKGGILGSLVSIVISLASMVLVVVVMIPFMQWAVSQLTGGARLAKFETNPVEYLGMFLGFVLFSILIVTIPWSVAWFMKWWLSRYSLPARSSMVAGSGYPV